MFILTTALMAQLFTTDIRNQIYSEANRQGLEPAIALAVATVESNLNVHAVGKQGEVGLFQLHPSFFPVTTTRENIRLGVQHLLYWKANCPVQKGYGWVTCYNQGARNPHHPELLPYYKKVKAVMDGME